MKEALRKLVIAYITEALNTRPDKENVEYMAESFVAEVERTLNARKDFKDE